ncbi:MAG: histidine kinase [Gammaproteobacteria bacterium]|nr:MAG: histidine kinase [Gammaproteobacteria bacterium]
MDKLAKDIMTPHVKSVPENWTIQQFARFCSDNDISGSPVVNAEGSIVGIATLQDVADFHFNSTPSEAESELTEDERIEARKLRQFLFEEMQKMPVEVRDIMSPIVFSVAEESSIGDVAQQMMDEHLHRIFVTKDGQVTGIITTYDLLRLIVPS